MAVTELLRCEKFGNCLAIERIQPNLMCFRRIAVTNSSQSGQGCFDRLLSAFAAQHNSRVSSVPADSNKEPKDGI